MRSILIYDYEPLNIQIKVVYNSKQKNLIYRFKPGQFYISSPKRLDKKSIEAAVLKYEAKIKQYCCNKSSDPILHLWGQRYNLVLCQTSFNQVLVDTDKIIVYSKTKDFKRLIKSFYVQELTRTYLPYYKEIWRRVEALWAQKIEVKFKGISYYKSFLGRCFWQKHEIELSGYLAKYPKTEIKSVIAHEFAHLFVHNHSKAFKDILFKIDTNYDQHLKTIKELNKEIRNDYI